MLILPPAPLITRVMQLSADTRNNENQTKIIIYIALFVCNCVVGSQPSCSVLLLLINSAADYCLCLWRCWDDLESVAVKTTRPGCLSTLTDALIMKNDRRTHTHTHTG